jgi:hypothetical protein
MAMTSVPIRTHALPAIEVLKRRLQSPAMLDAIFMPELLFRNYSYNAHWDCGEELGAMRNGSGDSFHALFTRAGAVLKGFECEDLATDVSLLSVLPDPLAGFASERAFEPEDVTFCFWRLNGEDSWGFAGSSLETATRFLLVPRHHALAYVRWAQSYYAHAVDRDQVERIFSFEPLTPQLVSQLNADADWRDVVEDASEIGYPIAAPAAY